jgi:hypothetical protein
MLTRRLLGRAARKVSGLVFANATDPNSKVTKQGYTADD